MTCAACGTENRAGRKFCVECGSALALKCMACGTPHAAGEKFCGECGAILVDGAPANAPVASAAKPSALGIRVKAEQADASTPLDGERKTVTALFGAPVAHEDHPQRALYAALRMQEELKRYLLDVADVVQDQPDATFHLYSTASTNIWPRRGYPAIQLQHRTASLP